jgi:hypothetical protein
MYFRTHFYKKSNTKSRYEKKEEMSESATDETKKTHKKIKGERDMKMMKVNSMVR